MSAKTFSQFLQSTLSSAPTMVHPGGQILPPNHPSRPRTMSTSSVGYPAVNSVSTPHTPAYPQQPNTPAVSDTVHTSPLVSTQDHLSVCEATRLTSTRRVFLTLCSVV